MTKFRKKPIVIEAFQWFENGDHPEDGPRNCEGKIVRYFSRPAVKSNDLCSECGLMFDSHGWIDTLEDGHRVCPSDWIITGIHGERYPCKHDIFEKTYDAVEDEGPAETGLVLSGHELERVRRWFLLLNERQPMELADNDCEVMNKICKFLPDLEQAE